VRGVSELMSCSSGCLLDQEAGKHHLTERPSLIYLQLSNEKFTEIFNLNLIYGGELQRLGINDGILLKIILYKYSVNGKLD
jgi:hypothetical protein